MGIKNHKQKQNELGGGMLSFDVYSATIGITIAIVFQFFALIYHVVERQIIALTNCITRSKYSYKIKIT